MTINEVCTELRSGNKMHLYGKVKMYAPHYSVTLRNIELGLAKAKTIQKFFNNYGYEGSFNDWHNVANLVFISMSEPAKAQALWNNLPNTVITHPI